MSGNMSCLPTCRELQHHPHHCSHTFCVLFVRLSLIPSPWISALPQHKQKPRRHSKRLMLRSNYLVYEFISDDVYNQSSVSTQIKRLCSYIKYIRGLTGVPQGLLLGPVSFPLYMLPLECNILRTFCLRWTAFWHPKIQDCSFLTTRPTKNCWYW